MDQKSPPAWPWWFVVVGLAFVHVIAVLLVEALIGPMSRGVIRRRFIPPYQPPWFYYVFIYVFMFPATTIFHIVRPGPEDGVFGMSLLVLTCVLWGCVWAEPIRRWCGWRPWRFGMRDALIVMTLFAVLVGGFAALYRALD